MRQREKKDGDRKRAIKDSLRRSLRSKSYSEETCTYRATLREEMLYLGLMEFRFFFGRLDGKVSDLIRILFLAL